MSLLGTGLIQAVIVLFIQAEYGLFTPVSTHPLIFHPKIGKTLTPFNIFSPGIIHPNDKITLGFFTPMTNSPVIFHAQGRITPGHFTPRPLPRIFLPTKKHNFFQKNLVEFLVGMPLTVTCSNQDPQSKSLLSSGAQPRWVVRTIFFFFLTKYFFRKNFKHFL